MFLLVSINPVSASGKCFYFNLGAGLVVPNKDMSSSATSYALLYGPTAAPSGVSLFSLPNVNWVNDYDLGFDFNLALGYRFLHNIRGDIEVSYQHIQRDVNGSFGFREVDALSMTVFRENSNDPLTHSSRHANVYSLMTNGTYDFVTSSKWTPSLGAGFGVAWLRSKSTNVVNVLTVTAPPATTYTPNIQTTPVLRGSAFAWQCKAGLAYQLKRETAIEIQYRLFGTTRFMTSTSTILTNPGVPGQNNLFIIPETSIGGLFNSMLDLNIRFDV